MGNISLVKVGGVCAILLVVSGILARIVFGNAWLASRGVDTLVTGHWFDVLALLLAMPAALGFYRALDEAGANSATVGVLTLGYQTGKTICTSLNHSAYRSKVAGGPGGQPR